MSDAERLAAIGRVLAELDYITVGDADDGKRWVVIDGSGWLPAADAQVLLDLVREHLPDASWRNGDYGT